MDILGISGFYHDSAAVIVRDGRIVAAAHLQQPELLIHAREPRALHGGEWHPF
jgi:hypothetical protein